MNRLGCALALLACAIAAQPAAAQGDRREITRIAGDLYRFQNNSHFSVFLVTPDGVIVTDPIDAAAAAWLELEIEKRFAKPIRYLVYSHDHRDHIAGGEVFADTATVVAHENARRTIIAEKRPTAVPDITFSDRMTITLGGKRVELVYLGLNHSDNSIVMRFPGERALFAVDFISVKRVPYRDLSDSYFPDWVESVKRVEAMDFDIFVPGHGELGTRNDVSDHRRYLEALYDGVLTAARRGKSLDQIKSELVLEEFSHFAQYDAWRELNIEGVHRQVVLHRRGN